MSTYRANHQPWVAAGEIDHHVDDMMATIAADVPLRVVQETFAKKEQWLPIDGDPAKSVGELVETNSTGPLRLGYGAWRDLLLGVQFCNGMDELITAGGRTVKNVAGYDLTKFIVGQHGIFGRVETITTRTYKRPAGSLLVKLPPNPRIMQRLIPSPLRPQWALLTREALLCGYLGDERTLVYYERATAELKPTAIETRTLDEDVEHRAALWRGKFRASVPPAKVADFVAVAEPSNWVADPAFGIVLGDGESIALRQAATALGGTVFDPRSGETARLDFHLPPGPQRDLLERLKRSFDPHNRLAPLPWLAPA